MRTNRTISGILFLLLCITTNAQKFFNLTAQEVRIDSLLPVFNYAHPLGEHYADSTYSISIVYPEFIDMSKDDIQRYQQLSNRPLGILPEISQQISVSRKEGTLHLGFVPIVYRNGKYQKLVSFQLKIKGKAITQKANRRAKEIKDRYVNSSVLATGTWAKIRIPATGIYQLTNELIRKAGFSDINKVKIYGYGGALQPEKLTEDYLIATDDLQELPTCTTNGKRLFYGIGPVNWNDSYQRIRNPYSNYGYYFLTESEDGG